MTPAIVPAAPIARWVDERLNQYQADGCGAARDAVAAGLGWSTRKLSRVRNRRSADERQVVGVVDDYDLVDVETALDRVGVALWEVYPELADGPGGLHDRWCPSCRETVTVGEDACCPWCETATIAEAPKRRGGGKPAGKYGRLTDTHLRALHRAHTDHGMSINFLGKKIHATVGYASHHTAAVQIRAGWKRLGLPARERIEATVLASTKHGRGRRNRDEKAYRRWLMAERGWNSQQGPGRPQCTAIKLQSPGKGRRCQRHALTDSEFCVGHDPRRELERQAALARMRRRRPRPDMLAMEPFAAWLGVLRDEHGSIRKVADLLDAPYTAVCCYARGLGTNKRPKATISLPTVQRYAQRVGTTVEEIYAVEREAVAA